MTQPLHILLITPQLPYPPHQGASLRNYYILKGLTQTHHVSLLTFSEPEQRTDKETLAPLYEACEAVSFVPAPQRSKVQRLIKLLTNRRPDMAHRLADISFDLALKQLLAQHTFDIVQIEGLELARVIPIVRQLAPQATILFDNHNAESSLQYRTFQTDLQQVTRWLPAIYSWVQTHRLRQFERWACQQADLVTAVSEADKIALQTLVPEKEISVIPNCIDVTQYTKSATEETPRFDLVFSGKMDYRPNIDAMLWFAEEIFPRICEARPNTTLAIVGQKPHPRLGSLRNIAGITITGWVEHIQPYLAGATVLIMPLRMGSGTRLKLIEGMASGKAIVSTPIGAEGFPLIPNKHLLVETSSSAFANAILTLLTQPQRREQLGAEARQFAQLYDWRQVIPLFLKKYADETVT